MGSGSWQAQVCLAEAVDVILRNGEIPAGTGMDMETDWGNQMWVSALGIGVLVVEWDALQNSDPSKLQSLWASEL